MAGFAQIWLGTLLLLGGVVYPLGAALYYNNAGRQPDADWVRHLFMRKEAALALAAAGPRVLVVSGSGCLISLDVAVMERELGQPVEDLSDDAAGRNLAWGALEFRDLGGMHGLYLVANHVWRASGMRMPGAAGRVLTMVAVLVELVPFRAEGLAGAWRYWGALAGGEAGRGMPGGEWQMTVVAALGLGVLFAPAMPVERLRGWQAVGLAVAFFLCLLLMRETTLRLRQSELIYFRF